MENDKFNKRFKRRMNLILAGAIFEIIFLIGILLTLIRIKGGK